MKHTEVKVTTVTEEIVTCDICHNQIYEKIPPLSRAGHVSIGGCIFNYGLNIIISNEFGPGVEHICRNCLAEALKNITETI